MLKTLILIALSMTALAGPVRAADIAIGRPAPGFTGTDTHGKTHSLSDYKGKPVVLEWTNVGCPFVGHQYGTGNMQKLQKDYTAKGVIWLSIASSAKGKQGYQTPDEANKTMAEQHSAPTARLLDPAGTIGKLYGARTTPQMFVIDKDGVLAYEGAIDDNDDPGSDIAKSKNYVAAALDSLLAGKKVETAQTKPYGCGVKYD